jgi:butyrate kinase
MDVRLGPESPTGFASGAEAFPLLQERALPQPKGGTSKAKSKMRSAALKEEILTLVLQGFNFDEIGRVTGYAHNTIVKYAQDPELLAEVKKRSKELYEKVAEGLAKEKRSLQERLTEAASVALDEMLELAQESGNEKVRREACDSLLDRTAATSRHHHIDGDTKHSFMNPLTLIHAAQVAKEMDAKSNDRLIDVGGGGESGGVGTSAPDASP